jgi:hypothetical protein
MIVARRATVGASSASSGLVSTGPTTTSSQVTMKVIYFTQAKVVATNEMSLVWNLVLKEVLRVW